ncbi:MAG: glycosyltransferase [Candidatus Aenigmarchaeota archaeon]|nr:glycosyltransferase [Candidatus Aenigmarchaeota archaeon]
MKKMLFLTSRFPISSTGDGVRVLQQLEMFSQWFEITLVTFYEGEENLEKNKFAKKYCKNIYTLKLDTLFSGLRYKLDLVKLSKLGVFIPIYLFFQMPLQVKYYTSKKMLNFLQKLNDKTEFDILFVNLIRMAEYGKHLNIPFKVLDYTDAISYNYFLRKRYEKNILWKIYLLFEQTKIESYEKNILQYYDIGTVISERDRNWILKDNKVDERKIKVIPNYIKCKNKFERTPEKGMIVFVGRMNSPPNIDAAIWFAKEIFPKVKEKVPYAKFYIVGADPTEEIRALHNGNDIIVTGFVEDPKEYLKKAQVFVAPIRFGAGLQNKVLEAMSVGVPIVASKVVWEGVGKSVKEEYEEEMVRHIIRLLTKSITEVDYNSYLQIFSKKKVRKLWKMTLCRTFF